MRSNLIGVIVAIVIIAVIVIAFLRNSATKRPCPSCHTMMPIKKTTCPKCGKKIPLNY